jgi:hypothetical protein
MFPGTDYDFSTSMSPPAQGLSLSPDHLISPLALDSDNRSQIIPVLSLDSVLDKHSIHQMSGMLTSNENQRPITKVAMDTLLMAKKALEAVCEEVPRVTVKEFLSSTMEEISPPASEEGFSIMITPPTDDSTPRSTTTDFSLPFEATKDTRQASIEDLRLGPLAEEGVNILVEQDGVVRSFLVHTELLCHFSPYFRTFFGKREAKVFTKEVESFKYTDELDFDGNTAEYRGKEEGSVALDIKVNIPVARSQNNFRLPDALGDIKHAAFAAFIEWLYLGPAMFGAKEVTVANQLLIRLWVLAGRVGIPSCQNDCIAAIEVNRKLNRTINTSMLWWVYNNTREYGKTQCGLKNLLIDQCALALDEKWLLEGIEQPGFVEQFPLECLFDIIARMRVLLRESSIGEGSPAISPTSRRYWIDDGKSQTV